MVPLLALWAGFPQHRAHGISLAAIVPIAAVGAVIYYRQDSRPAVDLGFGIMLMVGTVAGAYLGARLVKRVPETTLRAAVGGLLAIVGVRELFF